METMRLFKEGGNWMVQTDNAETIALFDGCDTLPTPFRAFVDSAVVLARLQQLNPDANIVLN